MQVNKASDNAFFSYQFIYSKFEIQLLYIFKMVI